MSPLSWEMVRLLALLVVFIPVLVVNLRTGNLPNWCAAIVLVAGLALGLSRTAPLEAPWLFWVLGTLGWFGIFAGFRAVPGGLVKIAIAFLPWFHDPGEYLWFITIAFGIIWGLSLLLRREPLPAAPGLLIAGLGLFTFAAFG